MWHVLDRSSVIQRNAVGFGFQIVFFGCSDNEYSPKAMLGPRRFAIIFEMGPGHRSPQEEIIGSRTGGTRRQTQLSRTEAAVRAVEIMTAELLK